MQRLTPTREAEILDAYKRYGSVKDAAFAVLAGVETVRRIAREAGVLRPHGTWSRLSLPSDDELLQMVKRLGSHAAVARDLGCHVNTIRNRLYGRRGK